MIIRRAIAPIAIPAIAPAGRPSFPAADENGGEDFAGRGENVETGIPVLGPPAVFVPTIDDEIRPTVNDEVGSVDAVAEGCTDALNEVKRCVFDTTGRTPVGVASSAVGVGSARFPRFRLYSDTVLMLKNPLYDSQESG